MNTPSIDREKCAGCGLCAEVCGLDVITRDGGGCPVIGDGADCNACGHCVAICPRGALFFSGLDMALFAPARPACIAAADMETFLSMKRSCREFDGRPVERPVIERLVNVARMAPTSINCQERAFIVVTDRSKIAELREALARHARSMLRLITLACGCAAAPFLSAETREYMIHLRADFQVALRHLDNGDDFIFHNAPCLVFFAGIAADPSGRDHALGAQHYTMLFAETLGLGSCINGYAQTAPKVLARHLEVPRQYAIYGAIMLGYRRHAYRTRVYRKPASVSYCE